MYPYLRSTALSLMALLLAQGCGPSAKDICNDLFKDASCILSNAAQQSDDPQAQSQLLLFQGLKESLVNSCIDSYEKEGKACQEALQQLNTCFKKANCSAQDGFPCETELTRANDRGCLGTAASFLTSLQPPASKPTH